MGGSRRGRLRRPNHVPGRPRGPPVGPAVARPLGWALGILGLAAPPVGSPLPAKAPARGRRAAKRGLSGRARPRYPAARTPPSPPRARTASPGVGVAAPTTRGASRPAVHGERGGSPGRSGPLRADCAPNRPRHRPAPRSSAAPEETNDGGERARPSAGRRGGGTQTISRPASRAGGRGGRDHRRDGVSGTDKTIGRTVNVDGKDGRDHRQADEGVDNKPSAGRRRGPL